MENMISLCCPSVSELCKTAIRAFTVKFAGSDMKQADSDAIRLIKRCMSKRDVSVSVLASSAAQWEQISSELYQAALFNTL